MLNIEEELKKKHFRVSIFGSARAKKGEETYEMVYDLAHEIYKKEGDNYCLNYKKYKLD
jgi:predicted Rossmann-fold nucleotide-binding protein